jgi:hypothetical protein
MAHGQNALRNGHCGREYASRRYDTYVGYGRIVKDLTHRRERAVAKAALHAELHDD